LGILKPRFLKTKFGKGILRPDFFLSLGINLKSQIVDVRGGMPSYLTAERQEAASRRGSGREAVSTICDFKLIPRLRKKSGLRILFQNLVFRKRGFKIPNLKPENQTPTSGACRDLF